jgi:monovalent cation:proton antiporter-2 (CPA2) family protein
MLDETGIKHILIFLVTAGIVIPLLGRFRVGVVPGFLIAGVVLGPLGLGRLASEYPWVSTFTFTTDDHVLVFADLGVLFLLFLIGLEFSLERLWAMRKLVLGLGSVQFVVSTLVILAGVSLVLHDNFDLALIVGLALALSSTAIVTQVLIEARRFAAPVGQVSIAVLLFQDLMVVPVVIIVGLLGGGNFALHGAVFGAIALAIAALAIILFAGRYLIGPLLHLAAKTGSREIVVAIALLLAIGTAVVTNAAGLSPALGAFLAGLLLGESEYRHQIEVDIEPFKGILLGLFFMTVGTSVDVVAVAEMPLAYIGALIGLLVVKALILVGGARLFGLEIGLSIEAALVLAGAGEFAFVTFKLASEEHLLTADQYQFLVSVAALAMLTIPLLAIAGRKLAAFVDRRPTLNTGVLEGFDRASIKDHVIIGGFGRVGRTIGRVLDAERIPFIALDLDADLVAEQRKAGLPVFFGDASRHEILERVGAARARAFVVTTNEPNATERVVRSILAAWPDATIHARALDADHAEKLAEIGVKDVVPEALEGSLLLAGRILASVGMPDDAISARLDAARQFEIRRLDVRRAQASSAHN